MTSVSVIIPYHNEENLLGECLESVFRQPFDGKLEVLVIDDASDVPPPKNIVRRWPIRMLRSDVPLHAAGARQMGINHATGEYVCFLDADDIYASNRYVPHIEMLEKHADMAFVGGKHVMHRGKSWLCLMPIINKHFPALARTGGVVPESIRLAICGCYGFTTGAFTARRACLTEVGGFRTHYRWGEEWDLQVRLAQVGRVGYVPSVCMHYRHRPGSITSTLSAEKFVSAALMRRSWRREISGLPHDLRQSLRKDEQNNLLLAAQTYLEHEKSRVLAFRCATKSLATGLSWWGVRSMVRASLHVCLPFLQPTPNTAGT